ncbi:MAG: fused signal recognition particle receptor [Actinomycetota bacterium]|jgi:fused signal recognition particle receptor|nr:fused signal recognition particle receptor [Actinomycetota bacterium]
MEPILLVVIFVLVAVTTAGVVVARRRPRGIELEPPPPSPELVEQVEEALAEVEAPVLEAPVPQPQPEPEPEPEPEVVKPRFRDRLGKARSLLAGYVGSVLSRTDIDNETWDELEEALVRADVGVGLTTDLLDELSNRVKAERITNSAELLDALKAELKKMLDEGDRSLRYEAGGPNVWLFVGVNGVGKTTTIGKLGKREAANGHQVVMAAGDTFRAAAAEQLELWSKRAGADLVRGAEGADPGSVIFDAVERAAARNADLVLADTAGRLHTKVNLMEELKKVRRIAERPPAKLSEVLLVIDATTGQNGLVQAKQFTDAVGVTGIVLTKLDGTAKGGIALAIQHELGIPIKLVGLGESADDLVEFDPDEFVEALFS